MDTQDFLDNIKSWLEFYRDVRIPDLEYPPATKEVDLRWENGMLKVASAFTPCESLLGTPAEKLVRKAASMAKENKGTYLKEIYDILVQVEKYLGETLNR